MRRKAGIGLALVVFAGAAVLGGCRPPIRTITHVSAWSGDRSDYLYIAYAENDDVSKIRRCIINDDNTMTCHEEQEVNALLNED